MFGGAFLEGRGATEGISYELKYADGASTFVTNLSDWQVRSEFVGHGNRHFGVTTIIPVERLEEFVVDGPLLYVWRSSQSCVVDFAVLDELRD